MAKTKASKKSIPRTIPIIPVTNVVLFPKMISPVVVNNATKSFIDYLKHKKPSDRIVGVLQKKNDHFFYDVGTVALVVDMIPEGDGVLNLSLQGIKKFKVDAFIDTPYLKARISVIKDSNTNLKKTLQSLPAVISLFYELSSVDTAIAKDVVSMARSIKNPSQVMDMIVASINISFKERQMFLDISDVYKKLNKLITVMSKQLEEYRVSSDILKKTKESISKKQKEHYLRQQLEAINKELGEDPDDDIRDYEDKITAKNLPEDAEKEARQELKRLKRVGPGSQERSVITTYLDWMLELPWGEFGSENIDLKNAQKILDGDHYGLGKAKKRIVQYLAIKHLKDNPKSPVLCFVGPPGTGKTSMGRSIARALGREFVRISLGGVRDEAEIRGHRRTYVGALPGRIIKGLKVAGTSNPVFMLDEIDKLSSDFRGDPSSALLEALDPEQNHSFSDHYLETPYDLSRVMFITTANTLDTVPPALKDRLDKIEFSGYTSHEKLKIAKQFLVKKQRGEHGLKFNQIKFTDAAINKIITDYTYESGVRTLERRIAEISRGVVSDIVSGSVSSVSISKNKVRNYLGKEKVPPPNKIRKMLPGMVPSLFTDSHGGHVSFIETSKFESKDSKRERNIILTGQLGEILKESASIALSHLCSSNIVSTDEISNSVIHIHIPAGATPKDGSSAGVALFISLASIFSNVSASKDVTMSGEITLTGDVLPVGGIKHKVLAAHRAGMKTIVLPKWNEKDLDDIPQEVKDEMRFVFINTIKEALKIALPNLGK